MIGHVRRLGCETGRETGCSGEAGTRRAGATPTKRLKTVIVAAMSAAARARRARLAGEFCGQQSGIDLVQSPSRALRSQSTEFTIVSENARIVKVLKGLRDQGLVA